MLRLLKSGTSGTLNINRVEEFQIFNKSRKSRLRANRPVTDMSSLLIVWNFYPAKNFSAYRIRFKVTARVHFTPFPPVHGKYFFRTDFRPFTLPNVSPTTRRHGLNVFISSSVQSLKFSPPVTPARHGTRAIIIIF